jgi:hypothetical protein
LNYRKDIASQNGEDGIIEQIFSIIPPGDKWCVEFGAWDGKHFSNTYNLIKNKGWSGVLIEGKPERCKQIANVTHAGNNNVHVINAYVQISGDNTIDNILSNTPIPKDFDFISIDIDGNDYHIYKSMINYKPKVVLIEYNGAIPDNIEFVQEPNFSVRHGHSILSTVKLAKSKGYELICINADNAFFVDSKYFPLFNLSDNSIGSIKHFNEPLQVFQLYDGTLVFYGYQSLHYYNIPMNFNKRFQMVPKYIRNAGLPWGDASRWKKLFLRGILKIYDFLYRDRNAKSWEEYISEHWIKWPKRNI